MNGKCLPKTEGNIHIGENPSQPTPVELLEPTIEVDREQTLGGKIMKYV